MYSAIVLEHFHNPRNAAPLDDATHQGVAGSPGEGPYMQMWLDVRDGVIERAGFQTYGCPGAVASGSLVTELITGKPVEIAQRLEAIDIIRLLGGLPAGKEHCAELAATGLRNALRDGD